MTRLFQQEALEGVNASYMSTLAGVTHYRSLSHGKEVLTFGDKERWERYHR